MYFQTSGRWQSNTQTTNFSLPHSGTDQPKGFIFFYISATGLRYTSCFLPLLLAHDSSTRNIACSHTLIHSTNYNPHIFSKLALSLQLTLMAGQTKQPYIKLQPLDLTLQRRKVSVEKQGFVSARHCWVLCQFRGVESAPSLLAASLITVYKAIWKAPPGLKFVLLTKQRVNALILQLHKVYSCFTYFRSQGADRRPLANLAVKFW